MIGELENARDLGGLPVAGGGETRRGVLLRTASPYFWSSSQIEAVVGDLGVRTCVDLRSPGEISEATNWELLERLDSALCLPLAARRGGQSVSAAANPIDRAAAHYLGFLEQSGDQLGILARLLADHGEGALMVHCTLGKDRTGVSVAVLLQAVGVSDEGIVGDYVRTTAETIDAALIRLSELPGYRERIERLPDESLSVDPQIMARFLATVRHTYGGAAAYLEQRGGVSAVELECLAQRLVEA